MLHLCSSCVVLSSPLCPTRRGGCHMAEGCGGIHAHMSRPVKSVYHLSLRELDSCPELPARHLRVTTGLGFVSTDNQLLRTLDGTHVRGASRCR